MTPPVARPVVLPRRGARFGRTGSGRRLGRRAAGVLAVLSTCLVAVVAPDVAGPAVAGAAIDGPAAPDVCTAPSLRAWGSWQGATGSMLGGVDLANVAARTCALRGYVTVTLRDQAGRELPVRVRPARRALHGPAVRRPPQVTLPPFQRPGAVVDLEWFNWCGPRPTGLTLSVRLPGAGRVAVRPDHLLGGFDGVARCDDRRLSSFLVLGPIAPPPPTVLHPTVVPLGTPVCRAAQLRVHGGRQGGGYVGVALGQIVLTHLGAGTCVLSGIPSVTLLAANQRALAVTAVAPQNAQSNPVLVGPGGSGDLDVSWSNWCGAAPGPLAVAVTPAGGSTTVRGPFDGPPAYDFVPGCRDAAQPSTLTVTLAFGTP